MVHHFAPPPLCELEPDGGGAATKLPILITRRLAADPVSASALDTPPPRVAPCLPIPLLATSPPRASSRRMRLTSTLPPPRTTRAPAVSRATRSVREGLPRSPMTTPVGCRRGGRVQGCCRQLVLAGPVAPWPAKRSAYDRRLTAEIDELRDDPPAPCASAAWLGRALGLAAAAQRRLVASASGTAASIDRKTVTECSYNSRKLRKSPPWSGPSPASSTHVYGSSTNGGCHRGHAPTRIIHPTLFFFFLVICFWCAGFFSLKISVVPFFSFL
ncbi:hypothetical protein PVAP13_9NG304746 [Panicum virgatum]|uniref:Uncharacterized protein n=1 Tax=Panicum virgatum TaxID=38727 RepID=A0A8T0MK77_PANVG|nr:hypothetical protein PVAP13_9NG304746 [Panicum virgatum]